MSTLTDHDIYLFKEGNHPTFCEKLGASCAVRGVGAECHGRIGHRRFQWLGHAGAHPLNRAGTARESGKVFVPGIGHGRAYKYRVAHAAETTVDKGRSVRHVLLEVAAPHRTGPACGISLTHGAMRNGCRTTRQRNALDAPMSIYEVHLGSWRRGADGNRSLSYREIGRLLVEHVRENGLHPRRADAGHRASVLRLVGLPDHRLFRADRALRHAAGFDAPDRRPASARHRRDSRLGAVAFSRPTSTGSPTSTARICTSMPIRGRDFTRSGTAPSSTTAATKCARSCCRARCSGSTSTTSTGCASTRSRRCSTSTTAARTANGYPTSTAAGKTSRPFGFCAIFNEAVYRDHPDVQTIAEESTAWPMVSRPTSIGGLGFGLKWNMGWMHDTLAYAKRIRSTAVSTRKT